LCSDVLGAAGCMFTVRKRGGAAHTAITEKLLKNITLRRKTMTEMEKLLEMWGPHNFYRNYDVVPTLQKRLNPRASRCFWHWNTDKKKTPIKTLLDIDMTSDAMFLTTTPNFGVKSMREIRYTVAEFKTEYNITEPLPLKELVAQMKTLIQSCGVTDADKIWKAAKQQLETERARYYS